MFIFDNIVNIDHFLFQYINGMAFKWYWLDMLGIFFAKYLIYIMVLGLLFFLWKSKNFWRIAITALIAGLVARFVITGSIRLFRPRVRPFNISYINLLIDKVNQQSFPSGHASFSFALATVVYLYNKTWGMIFFAVAILISISRVFAGVHWPLDILVGALVGIFSGWLINKIIRKLYDVKRISRVMQKNS